MSSNINHHYIPKFYLRYFSFEKNGKNIGLYNIKNKLFVSQAKLKTQATKKFYYGKNDKLEKELSEIEGYCAIFLKWFINNQKKLKLGSPDHKWLLIFLNLFFCRNPLTADLHHSQMNQVLNAMYPDIGFGTKFNFVMKVPSEIHIRNLEKHVLYTIDLNIILLENHTNIPFISSDNPYVIYNQYFEHKQFKAMNGIASSGIQIFFPLNPKFCILLYDIDFYKIGNKNQNIIPLTFTEDINQINSLQVINTYSTLFFNEMIDESYLLDLLRNIKCISSKDKAILDRYDFPERRKTLLFSRLSENKIDLNLSFIKFTKKSKSRNFLKNKKRIRKYIFDQLEEEKKAKLFNGSFDIPN
jgi:Protein of unknown function (DUF4238)